MCQLIIASKKSIDHETTQKNQFFYSTGHWTWNLLDAQKCKNWIDHWHCDGLTPH